MCIRFNFWKKYFILCVRNFLQIKLVFWRKDSLVTDSAETIPLDIFSRTGNNSLLFTFFCHLLLSVFEEVLLLSTMYIIESELRWLLHIAGIFTQIFVFSHLRLSRSRRLRPWKSAILHFVAAKRKFVLGSWALKDVIQVGNVANCELENFNLGKFLVRWKCRQQFSQISESDVERLDANSLASCMRCTIFLRRSSTSCDEREMQNVQSNCYALTRNFCNFHFHI